MPRSRHIENILHHAVDVVIVALCFFESGCDGRIQLPLLRKRISGDPCLIHSALPAQQLGLFLR